MVAEQEGIDGRALRSQAGFGAKEDKKAFDRGLLDLQGCADIVISGTKEKRGSQKAKSHGTALHMRLRIIGCNVTALNHLKAA
ncbi:hypothetical protein P9222_26655 [Paenibacillus amylolyticus]|nr:hypothetical protein [Paenibacillus amylolyticus]WFR61874.1 hypothetical protein P9222_26655 [Paenibacillus amylolyticus]